MNNRIVSMDQFRGYTIVGMILVNFIGDFKLVPDVFKHHNTYFSYADSIMPAFHFCVGFAMRLTLLKRLATQGAGLTYWQFVRRNLGLILIALVFFPSWADFKSWEALTNVGLWGVLAGPLKSGFWNTLAIIGVTSLFVLPVMAARWWVRVIFMAAMAAVHVWMSDSFYFDFMWGRPNWFNDYWRGGVGDRTGLDGGPLGCVGWSIAQIAGSLAYDLIATKEKRRAAETLFVCGAAFMIIAYVLSCCTRLYDVPPGTPKGETVIAESPVRLPFVNLADRSWSSLLAEPPFVKPPPGEERQYNYWMMSKRVCTLSFILFATGFALALYSVFVVACDATGFQLGAFRTFGVNPLAAYIIHLAVANAVHRFAPGDSPWAWIAFSFALYFGVTYLMVWYLEKQKIFLRM